MDQGPFWLKEHGCSQEDLCMVGRSPRSPRCCLMDEWLPAAQRLLREQASAILFQALTQESASSPPQSPSPRVKRESESPPRDRRSRSPIRRRMPAPETLGQVSSSGCAEVAAKSQARFPLTSRPAGATVQPIAWAQRPADIPHWRDRTAAQTRAHQKGRRRRQRERLQEQILQGCADCGRTGELYRDDGEVYCFECWRGVYGEEPPLSRMVG